MARVSDESDSVRKRANLINRGDALLATCTRYTIARKAIETHAFVRKWGRATRARMLSLCTNKNSQSTPAKECKKKKVKYEVEIEWTETIRHPALAVLSVSFLFVCLVFQRLVINISPLVCFFHLEYRE